MIAFPGDHTRFEAPPLTEGPAARPGRGQVGLGLAQILNLQPGSTLAAQLPSGREVRFRVAGVVRAFERQGASSTSSRSGSAARRPPRSRSGSIRRRRLRVRASSGAPAWCRILPAGSPVSRCRAGRLARAASSTCRRAVPDGRSARRSRLPLRDRPVARADRAGAARRPGDRARARRRRQAAGEHRRRRGGSGRPARDRRRGRAERWVVGPAVARLAASYVSLSLEPTAPAVAATALGLALGTALTVLWATRLVTRGPVVGWLRER